MAALRLKYNEVLRERDGLQGEMKRLEAARTALNPEASSLAQDPQVVTMVESKETAELREKLDTATKENTALLQQFERQGDEIGVLRGANEMHQAKIKELTTDKTMQEAVNAE